jgi:adenosylmethionine-8-amino-7-oxononanoate aminotransferase
MHRLFRGVVPEQTVVPLDADLDGVLAAQDVAGVLIEPLVQGAGGMRFHDAATLRHIREACDQHDVLLVFDEIFTGFGRTGAMFACDAAGVVPDIVTLGKALTGGTLPLAATVATDAVFAAFLDERPDRALMHGPTFMGNALACAAANASLDLFEREPRLDQARAIEAQLADELAPARKVSGVKDVRVKGAIGVIQLASPADAERVTAHGIAEGVWLRPFRDIIYTTPPLTIGADDLSRIARAMVGAAKAR